MTRHLPLLLVAALLGPAPAHAQSVYNRGAGQNAPAAAPVEREYRDQAGRVHKKIVYQKPKADSYGNATGNQYDLAVDGAFEGQTVAVLHFYTMENFDFSLPRAALKEKGFSVYRWIGAAPSPAELERGLAKASQLWIISGERQLLTPAHLRVIKAFFDRGKGVYIWGDNQPYYADANAVAQALLGVRMHGNLPGDQTVGILGPRNRKAGVIRNHLLSTGLEFLYEGITIATIEANQVLRPLIYGHEGNLVAAYYDKGGKRAILDGGFTRLYYKWDTAGTARYVKNAAAWLVNVERFGEQVVAQKDQRDKKDKRKR
jgi:hypothetical protein